MKKSRRVKSETDFQRVFKRGHSVANRQFVVYQVERSEQPFWRVGFSVSKRLGNAVKRNNIKRRMRHAVRDLDRTHGLRDGVDLVIIARNPVSRMSFAEIKSSLTHVLNLADLFLSKK